MAEYWLGTDPGVPLEDTMRIPGTAVPVNGQLTPSSAPGFGMEFESADISDWTKSERGSA
jgi:L-rhamnonate dehydratase